MEDLLYMLVGLMFMLTWFMVAIWTAMIAWNKNRLWVYWFIIPLIIGPFGFIAMIAAGLLPKVDLTTKRRAGDEVPRAAIVEKPESDSGFLARMEAARYRRRGSTC